MTTGGFSGTRLGVMREVMAGYAERGEVHVEVYGSKTLGDGDPIRRDTIFRIASMTKAVTAVAAMMLVEECKLRLDDPVDRLLPELTDRRVLKRLEGPLDDTIPAHRPITLRDLLTFRMGFGIPMAPPGTYPIQTAMSELLLGQGPPRPQTPPPPDEWIRRLGTLPLMHQPGERWMYHTGSDVLGVLIARASGLPLETFFRERIFEPLGMMDTAFSVPAAKIDRLATSYWTQPETGELEVYDPAEGEWSSAPAFPSGGAGLVSTIDDYLAFGQMLQSHGKHGSERILSRPSVEMMTTDQLTQEQKATSGFAPRFFDSHGWGFGVSIVTRREELAGSIGTFGWAGGLGTSWCTDPPAKASSAFC